MSFPIGTPIDILVEFRLPADPPSIGALVDPTEVVLQIMRPDGYKYEVRFTVSSSYGQITKVGQGSYSYRLKLSQSGKWRYRYSGIGTYEGTTGDLEIPVDPSDFPNV